ncbi:MAG: ribose-5-phosphate isomerase RpiA [Deltaproteobacteria bacterium]|jgi:ribose 5-phosphate isomerase A
MQPQDLEKKTAAVASLAYVEDGMRLGLGSGSTSAAMVHALGEKVRDGGLRIECAVPTSAETRAIAESYGIPIKSLDDVEGLDLTIDGADEADPKLALIKGGGGALTHEKIVASASAKFVVIVDASKLVDKLGAFRVPVEVLHFAARPVKTKIEALGGKVTVREKGGAPFVTEEGNLIYDCDFGLFEDAHAIAAKLAHLPGLVEHGLFVDMADVLIVGRGESTEVLTR